VRGYLTGSTSTSIWTQYARGVRAYCGHDLPSGLCKNDRLPAALLTPTTKARQARMCAPAQTLTLHGARSRRTTTSSSRLLRSFLAAS